MGVPQPLSACSPGLGGRALLRAPGCAAGAPAGVVFLAASHHVDMVPLPLTSMSPLFSKSKAEGLVSAW